MDAVGFLEIGWSTGYGGAPISFVTSDILCFACANTINFYNLEGQPLHAHKSLGMNIGCLTAHHSGIFAYNDRSFPPRLFILSYPDFTLQRQIDGAAELEFRDMAFSSNGKHLVTLAGLPDFRFCIWETSSGDLVCQSNVASWPSVSRLFVCQSNWKQICIAGPECCLLWTVEECGSQYMFTHEEVVLPKVTTPSGTKVPGQERLLSQSAKDINQVQPYYPFGLGSVVGSFGGFHDTESQSLVSVMDVSWAPGSILYCSCKGGQIFSVDTDSMDVTMVHNPGYGNGGNLDLKADSTRCLALNKKGVYVAGEDGSVSCLVMPQVVETVSIGQPISSLVWSPDFSQLIAGTSQGSLFRFPSSRLEDNITILDHHTSSLAGMDVLLKGDEQCVTCRRDGTLQLWSLSVCSQAACLNLETPCCSLAASPSSSCCAVGTDDGRIVFIDAQKANELRVIKVMKLHQGPVNYLRFDPTGSFLLSAGEDKRVFACSAHPSRNFEVWGYLSYSDPVSGLAVTGTKETAIVCVTLDTSHAETPFPRLFTTFALQMEWLEGANVPASVFSDSTCLLSSSSVQLRCFDLDVPVCSFDVTYLSDDETLELYALSEKSKKLFKYKIPSSPESEKDVSLLPPHSQHDGHQLPGGNVAISPHGRWLASCSADGQIIARLTASLGRAVSTLAHDYSTGGVAAICFTGDCQKMLCAGKDGSLSCWNWRFSGQGKRKGAKAVDAFRSHSAALKRVTEEENEHLAGMGEIGVEDELDGKATWLDQRIAEARRLEDEKYGELKAEIRESIAHLRENVLKKIQSNSEVPEIERLERQEFNLDTEEQHRLVAFSRKQIDKVKEDIELENIKKLYVTEMIRKECWDGMEVPGKTITGFGNNLEVRNYPIRKRTLEEVQELEFASMQRKIEIAELDAQSEICKNLPKHPLGFDDEEEGLDEGLGGENSDSLALHGSRGPEFGGINELFYGQMDIVTAERKHNQIVLLNDCVAKIKAGYNKEFDDLLQQKEAEVMRIQEKNLRICKIVKNLQLDETIYEPRTGSDEHPEMDLVVKDEEVTVEKFVSEEEQKRIEEESKAAEERRLAEMGDNARERALDMMMGGRLEVKTEEDIFKDLPKPEFMTAKTGDTWTEEEHKTVKEYEKKQTALLEEREKHRLALDAELKKLQTSITSACSSFDAKVLKLHHLRIKAETAVYEEELKILRLTWSLLIEEELAEKEELLQLRLEDRKAQKVQTGALVSEFKKEVETFKENYESVVQDDKAMDRSFKKDFSDGEPFVDALYRCFKRRPRGQFKTSVVEPVPTDPSSLNPYSVRPSSARGGGPRVLAAAWDELDGDSHRPDGVDAAMWQRLIVARRLKVEKEQQVKALALQLAEMNAFLQRRMKKDGDVQQEIEKTFRQLNKLREERNRMSQNLEMQLLLKQGQVEVDPGDFIPDFRDSVLVHRSVIEDLNVTIKTLGDGKIAAMNESKDFRKNIALLEWEHRKLNMEGEDLKDKARHIQLLKVTKELQAALLESDSVTNQQKEMSTLEETLAMMEEAHDRRRSDHKRRVTKFRRRIHRKAGENMQVDGELEGLAVNVAERQNVEKAQSQYPGDGGMERKMRDIRARRRLVETAKSQAQEVAVLRAEVERLRMRTFPALVQVERL
eukprot:m.140476 g.140476  ORF g.140476 m.140476 type:complete len:1641 (+) comp38310_c0_seq5:24-4946(+)